MKDGRSGFSFLEVIIAMLIVSILSGVVGLSLYRNVRRAKVEAVRTQIKTFQTALQLYRTELGMLPTENQGLEALVARPQSPPVPANYPPEGYLDTRRMPLDPWGNPYIYLVPGRDGAAYEIISYGADGEPGGEGEAADISSAEL